MSARPTALRATLDDRIVEIDVSPAGPVSLREMGHTTTLDVVRLEDLGPSGCLLSIGEESGTRWQATAVTIGDDVWVFVDGEVFEIEVEQAQHTPTRRRTRTEGTLTSPMPATVIGILVTPGQAVARGDTLVLLEAMKMELPVRAPRDGRVKAVLCSPGELVQPGVTLVEVDSDE